jgi:hypothetical protein
MITSQATESRVEATSRVTKPEVKGTDLIPSPSALASRHPVARYLDLNGVLARFMLEFACSVRLARSYGARLTISLVTDEFGRRDDAHRPVTARAESIVMESDHIVVVL